MCQILIYLPSNNCLAVCWTYCFIASFRRKLKEVFEILESPLIQKVFCKNYFIVLSNRGFFRLEQIRLHSCVIKNRRIPTQPRSVLPNQRSVELKAGSVRKQQSLPTVCFSHTPCKSQSTNFYPDMWYEKWLKAQAQMYFYYPTQPLLLLNFMQFPQMYFQIETYSFSLYRLSQSPPKNRKQEFFPILLTFDTQLGLQQILSQSVNFQLNFQDIILAKTFVLTSSAIWFIQLAYLPFITFITTLVFQDRSCMYPLQQYRHDPSAKGFLQN